MPYTRLPADDKIISGISITLSKDPDPIGGSVEGAKANGTEIPIQFPPKLNTDGKSGNWKTYDASTYEPIAIYSGAEARRISIELTYVVGAGSDWTGARISAIERMIRSYFYRRVEDAIKNTPIVEIMQLYGVTGQRARTTWRMKSVDVSFGDGIIIEDTFSFPLSRKITMELETYTKMAGRDKGGKAAAEAQKVQQGAENADTPDPPKSADQTQTPGEGGGGGSPGPVKQFQGNLENIVKNFWY